MDHDGASARKNRAMKNTTPVDRNIRNAASLVEYVIGVVLLLAAIGKLSSLGEFGFYLSSIRGIPKMPWIVSSLATGVISVELALGISHLLGRPDRRVRWGALAIFAGFLLWQGLLLLAPSLGLAPPVCPCFGKLEEALSGSRYYPLFRNLGLCILAVASLLLAKRAERSTPIADQI